VILSLIGNALVLGAQRERVGAGEAKDGNMLRNARFYCLETEYLTESQLVGATSLESTFDIDRMKPLLGVTSYHPSVAPPALIESNGDGEMWRRLCGFDNPRPVYVMSPSISAEGAVLLYVEGYFSPKDYPATAFVGDHNATVKIGISKDNHFPWCLRNALPGQSQALVEFHKTHLADSSLPICPSAWDAAKTKLTVDDMQRWATRGAVNAGMAVFLELDQRTRDVHAGKTPQPNYDACQEWEAAATK
jgi:hypothetical protein